MSAVPDTARSAPARRHALRKTLLMWLLPALVGVEFLENGMFVFAASHIAGGIDAAPSEFAQVLAAYAIGSMSMIGLQQWLSRHFGYRRYLTASLLLFLAGAVASALAQDLGEMLVARLLQGLGGGALFTSGRVLVLLLFSGADRQRATRQFMIGLFGLAALGPALSAWMVDGGGWRWVFLAPVPLIALTALGAWTLLPDHVGRSAQPVRWSAKPLLLFAAAITLLQLGLSEARYDLFMNPAHLALLGLLGLLLLAWFVTHQWGHPEPLLRLHDLRHPAYLLGLALYFLHYLLSNGSSYVFPVFAERALGLPIVTAGLLNSAAALVTLATAWAYTRTAALFPQKRPLMAVGAGMMLLSALLFSRIAPGSGVAALWPALIAKGVFGALFVLPVAGFTFRELGDERFAPGYQSKNLMRQLASSFGTAVAAVALTHFQFSERSQLAGRMHDATSAAWLDQAQASYAAHGLAPAQAHAAALSSLSQLVDQQALLLASGDLYRTLAALALGLLVFVLVQRRFL